MVAVDLEGGQGGLVPSADCAEGFAEQLGDAFVVTFLCGTWA